MHIQLHIAEMHAGEGAKRCQDLPLNHSTFVESRRINLAINRWATIQYYDNSNFPSKGCVTLTYYSPFSSPLSLSLSFHSYSYSYPPPFIRLRPGCITQF